MGITPENLNAALNKMLDDRLGAGNQAPAQQPGGWVQPPQAAGWQQPAPQPAASFVAPGGMPQLEGVLVPIEVQLPGGGNVRLYLQFGPEMAANPQALTGALTQLMQMGMPVKAWFPQQGGGGGGWRGGGGGGWQNRGGNNYNGGGNGGGWQGGGGGGGYRRY